MPKKYGEKINICLFLMLENSVFNKVKKIRFNKNPKDIENKKEEIKTLDLDTEISDRIDHIIKKHREKPIEKNFLNKTIEHRKPINKNPISPYFKTDNTNINKIALNKDFFDQPLPFKQEVNTSDIEFSDKNNINFYFHKKKKDKKDLKEKIPKIKINMGSKKSTKTKKKNKVTKAKTELEKAKEEIERKKQEIKNIEKKAKEKEIELKKKKIQKEKQMKKLEKEKIMQEKLKNKKEKQLAIEKEKKRKQKEKEEKLRKKKEEKLAKEKAKQKKLEEKKRKQIEQKKQKEQKKKEEKKQPKKSKPKAKKKIKPKKDKKTKISFNLFKTDKKETNIPKQEKTEPPQPTVQETVPNMDEELSQAFDIIDELLGELPDEKIDQFANSDDFEIYEKVIKKYKKK